MIMVTTRRVTTTEVHPQRDVVQVDDNSKVATYSTIAQIVYLFLGILEGLLLIRFFFRFAGANPGAGFVSFVYAITNVFMTPFRLIFPTSVITITSFFERSILVAMAVYALLAWIILHLIGITYTADQAD